MERDAIDAGVDQALQKSGRVAVAASAWIVGVIGDNQWFVAGLALPRQSNCLGNRQQFDRRESACVPGIVHEIFGNRLPPPSVAVDCDSYRRTDVMDIGAAEPGANAHRQRLTALLERLAAGDQF